MKIDLLPRQGNLIQTGFSLLEVLISIIILSFGLLGVVGLQAAALKANRESVYLSSATRLGRELSEMMETNRRIGELTIVTDNPYLVTFNSATNSVSAAAPITTNCWTGDCHSVNTAAKQKEIAQWQTQDWLYRLNSEIPGARVAICFDATPYDGSGLPQWTCSSSGTVAVIKIGWTRASTNSAPATEAAAFDRATRPAVILPVTL
jgi:type IV pilus assembly protein PilV